MGKVIKFGRPGKLSVDPDELLKEAIGNVSNVVILGYDEDGELYFASSEADGGNVMWLMESAKKALLEVFT